MRRRAAGRCSSALSSVLVGWLAAFGAGARVSALTFDLTVQARALGGSLSLWLLLGAAVFVGGDLVVEQVSDGNTSAGCKSAMLWACLNCSGSCSRASWPGYARATTWWLRTCCCGTSLPS